MIALVVNTLLAAGKTAVGAADLGGGGFKLKSTVSRLAGNSSGSGAVASLTGTALGSTEIHDGSGGTPAFAGGTEPPSGLATSYHEFGFAIFDPTNAGVTTAQVSNTGGSNTATFLWDGTKWSHVSGGAVLTS